jgi:hypothetical protein
MPRIGSNIRKKTSTILKANTLAMHGPLAKITDSKVNRCMSHDKITYLV